MTRKLLLGLALSAASGCACTSGDIAHNVIMPEQRSIDHREPAELPPAPIPHNVSPRTVTDLKPETSEWQLSLDEAIRIGLENAKVVRVLAGLSAVSSGQTIYDTAITNTGIDQAQGRFDPAVSESAAFNHSDTPQASLDPNLNRVIRGGVPTDNFHNELGLSKTNVLGGQWGLKWIDDPTHFSAPGFLLNPQNPNSLTLSYTQPLLQGGGFQVNTAPIVIARLNTEISYFQYKDSVQELVRGVIEGYWTLVQARTDVWARRIQVNLSKSSLEREETRLKIGFGDASNVAQARVTLNLFRANLVAAEAAVLAREGALRNLLGLPPSDDRQIIPVSAPTSERLKPQWNELVRVAEQRRPDIIELKIIIEADQQRLLQARTQALPKLDAVALYRWNGLSGEMPNGQDFSTFGGSFTDWSLGVNFSVPLGLRQGRAQVRQQELMIVRDRANLDQGLHAAVSDLASSVRDLDSAYEQYLAYKVTRAAAFENLKVQITNFAVGRSIYLTVLQALNDWGSAVSSEAGALLSYNVALSTLERRTGTILETHGLVFAEERFRAAGPLGILCQDREYPSALLPVGSPNRYPSTGEPSENSFDLRSPNPRGEPTPAPKPPVPAPPK